MYQKPTKTVFLPFGKEYRDTTHLDVTLYLLLIEKELKERISILFIFFSLLGVDLILTDDLERGYTN